MALSTEIKGRQLIYTKSHRYLVFSRKGNQRLSANWEVHELEDGPLNLNFVALYRLNKTFIHFCNQPGSFVRTYSRFSIGFKLKYQLPNEHYHATAWSEMSSRKVARFLTTLKFNIIYNRNSSSWFEDNIGSIRHDFIAIKLVQIVDTSKSETVNENKKQKQITSI